MQQALYTFLLERSQKIKGSTLNKDIKSLEAFLNWAEKKRYVAADFRIRVVKVNQRPVVALSPSQVTKTACSGNHAIEDSTGCNDRPQLTNEVYTNVDPVLLQAIEKLPVAGWL